MDHEREDWAEHALDAFAYMAAIKAEINAVTGVDEPWFLSAPEEIKPSGIVKTFQPSVVRVDDDGLMHVEPLLNFTFHRTVSDGPALKGGPSKVEFVTMSAAEIEADTVIDWDHADLYEIMRKAIEEDIFYDPRTGRVVGATEPRKLDWTTADVFGELEPAKPDLMAAIREAVNATTK